MINKKYVHKLPTNSKTEADTTKKFCFHFEVKVRRIFLVVFPIYVYI